MSRQFVLISFQSGHIFIAFPVASCIQRDRQSSCVLTRFPGTYDATFLLSAALSIKSPAILIAFIVLTPEKKGRALSYYKHVFKPDNTIVRETPPPPTRTCLVRYRGATSLCECSHHVEFKKGSLLSAVFCTAFFCYL